MSNIKWNWNKNATQHQIDLHYKTLLAGKSYYEGMIEEGFTAAKTNIKSIDEELKSFKNFYNIK